MINFKKNLGNELIVNLLTLMENPLEKEFEKVAEEKFLCSTRFSQEIEKVIQENSEMNYIDAICFYCEKNNIDLESVPKLLSKPLKEKIKCNAMELNFLKKTSQAKLVF